MTDTKQTMSDKDRETLKTYLRGLTKIELGEAFKLGRLNQDSLTVEGKRQLLARLQLIHEEIERRYN